MKIFFAIVTTFILCGRCNVTKIKNVQLELFHQNFNYADIKSIEIVEIEHPMLGGIVNTQTLTTTQQQVFIKRLQALDYDGPYKCANKLVIRIILANDTLRLKTCGEKISNKNSDMYYSLPANKPIISDLIK